MSRTLRLMDETDIQAVEKAVTEALPDRTATCRIYPSCCQRMLLTLETDIPAVDVGDVYRKAIAPLLGRLKDEFGEFGFELRALCVCGSAATPMISGAGSDRVMCLCGGCLGRRIDEHRDGPPNTCPVCKRGFNGRDNPGWSVRCSAKFVSGESGVGPEMDIETMQDPDGGTGISRRDCCSRKCALKQFQTWLSKVEAHPIVKEAGP